MRGRLHAWRGPWPPISVVGLIALSIALVTLVPSLIGIHKASVASSEARKAAVQAKAAARRAADLAEANRLLLIRVRRLAVQGARAHAGGCAFRASVADQIDTTTKQIHASKKFLRDIHEGRRQRIPGITDFDFTKSIRDLVGVRKRQRATYDSLALLRCKS